MDKTDFSNYLSQGLDVRKAKLKSSVHSFFCFKPKENWNTIPPKEVELHQ